MKSPRDRAFDLLTRIIADAHGGGFGLASREALGQAIDHIIEAARTPAPDPVPWYAPGSGAVGSDHERPMIVPAISFMIRMAQRSQHDPAHPDWATAAAHARLICDIAGLPHHQNMTRITAHIVNGT